MSAPTDPLAVLRSAMVDLASARQRYEVSLAVFSSARDALGLAIEAANQAAATALAAAFKEKSG